MTRDLIARKEAAHFLRVCRHTLTVIIASGKLKVIIIGKRKYIHRKELLKYLQK
jgi:excisionase family DNA binding protein